MTNEMKVIRFIAEHGSITYRQMTVDLWINSPRDVIARMRKKGYRIGEEVIKTNSGKSFKAFTL